MPPQKKNAVELSEDQLRAATESKSWTRGYSYFESGRVDSLLLDGSVIVARVAGTHSYTVHLRVENGEARGDCTCPMGEEGVFCKHCVAVGLTYLAGDADDQGESRGSRRTAKSGVSLDDVRDYLAKQETSVLVDIIVEQTKRSSSRSIAIICPARTPSSRSLSSTRRRTSATRHWSGPSVDWRPSPIARIDDCVSSQPISTTAAGSTTRRWPWYGQPSRTVPL